MRPWIRSGSPIKDRAGYAIVNQGRRSTLDAGIVALREDDALGIATSLVDDDPHDLTTPAKAGGQLLPIRRHVHGPSSDTCVDRRLGDGGRHRQRHPRVQWLGDEIGGTEAQRLEAVGMGDDIGDFFPSQCSQSRAGRDHHLAVDGTGPHVQGAPKDEWEAEHVVDLVRVVRSAGGDDGVRPGGEGVVVGDLRVWIGEGEDDGLRPIDRTMS